MCVCVCVCVCVCMCVLVGGVGVAFFAVIYSIYPQASKVSFAVYFIVGKKIHPLLHGLPAHTTGCD